MKPEILSEPRPGDHWRDNGGDSWRHIGTNKVVSGLMINYRTGYVPGWTLLPSTSDMSAMLDYYFPEYSSSTQGDQT